MTPSMRKEIARRIREKALSKFGHKDALGGFSCCTIDRCQEEVDPSHKYARSEDLLSAKYTALFSPTKRTITGFWLMGRFDNNEEQRRWRLAALLLFADMLEAGDV